MQRYIKKAIAAEKILILPTQDVTARCPLKKSTYASLALRYDYADNDQCHADQLVPQERLLSDGQGSGKREDGYGVVEDAGTRGAETSYTIVVERVGERGAADAKHQQDAQHAWREAETCNMRSVGGEHQWDETGQPDDVLPRGDDQGASCLGIS